MTELAEIQDNINLLTQVTTDLSYEINTNPGECTEAKAQMIKAKHNAQEAINNLSLAIKIMKVN